MVDLDPMYDPRLPTPSTPSGLRLALSKESTTMSNILPSTSSRYAKLPPGARVEISPESWKIMRNVGQVLGNQGGGGGAGLIVDYGGDRTFSDSFRASRDMIHSTILMIGFQEP